MGDLGTFLRFVSRIRFISSVGAAVGIAVGIMVLNGNFDPVLSVVLGIASVIVLVAGVGGLLYMQKLVDELEESFHRESFELSMEMMRKPDSKVETTDGQ